MTCSSQAARAGLAGLAVAAGVFTVTACGAFGDRTTSVVERDPVAAFHPAAERFAETLLARRARVPADLRDTFYEGVADLRVRRLAWVAGTEVEEIQALLLQLPAAFVEAQKRVGALPGEYGVEE